MGVIKMLKKFIGLSCLFLFIISCSSNKNVLKIKEPTKIKSKEIIVTEMGLSEKNIPENQQKNLSKQAAIIQTERAILRAIEVYLESEASTDKGIIKSDIIQEKIKGVLKGAEIVEVKYEDPATCYVTMKVSQKSIENLNEIISKMK